MADDEKTYSLVDAEGYVTVNTMESLTMFLFLEILELSPEITLARDKPLIQLVTPIMETSSKV